MYKRDEPICTRPEDVEAYRLYCEAVDLAGEGEHSQARVLFQRAFRMSPALSDLYGM